MRTHSTLIALVTAISLLPVFIALTLIRLSDYQEHQAQVARNVLANVSEMIRESVSEKRRMVNVFATEHQELLADIAQEPGDEALLGRLEHRIAKYFPDYFAFSITSTEGIPLIDDFDGKIGEICLADVKSFVSSGEQHPRIHPNPLAYHFDLIARWGGPERDGLLLISFHPDMLAEILEATQPAGHQLMLVVKEQDNLIEVTERGDRLSMPARLDFRMFEDELDRVLYQKQISGTRWHIVDLQEPEALSAIRTATSLQMAIVYLLFALVITVLWFFLRRYELQRQQLAKTLSEKNRILEDENRLALKVYDRITSRNNEYISNLVTHQTAMSTFSGDIQLSYGKNENRFYYLLGDFTGHGLGAALGAIPLADVFFSHARRQIPAHQLVRVCNDKLVEVLPTERFCCALLIMWDKTENTLTVCNAGLPASFLVGADRAVSRTFRSTMPPLGVTDLDKIETDTIAVMPDSYLLGYTDGIIEAPNSKHEQFGEERVMDCIRSSAPDQLFDRIVAELKRFTGSEKQSDDISLFLLSLDQNPL